MLLVWMIPIYCWQNTLRPPIPSKANLIVISKTSKMQEKGSKLSKFIWDLKDEGVNYQIKWRIVDRAPKYNPRTRKCALCIKEAYYINYHRHMATLNERTEVFSTCRHRNMETLSNTWGLNLFIYLSYLKSITLCYFSTLNPLTLLFTSP